MTATIGRLWMFVSWALASFAVAAAAWSVVSWLQLREPVPETRWIDHLYRIKTQAAEASDPTVLLVGGSGVHFGMDAATFISRTGLPAVNFGTHAGLGLPYILERARRALVSGDTVLLSLEYSHYADTPPTLIYLRYLAAFEPALFWSLDPRLVTEAIMSVELTEVMQPLLGARSGAGFYDWAKVDAVGDETGNRESDRTDRHVERLRLLERTGRTGVRFDPDGEAAARIRAFVEACRRRNVTVIASWPAVLDQRSLRTRESRDALERIRAFYGSLKVPVLGEPEDGLMPATAFFDTEYHLTHEAATRRTEVLADGFRHMMETVVTQGRSSKPIL